MPHAFPQGGSLTPPGAPAPSMKSLDQVEPRTPLIIGAADTAAVTTSNTSNHFIINLPGSYYLTGNLDVTKSTAIKISSSGVTIDLRGFEIRRSTGVGTGTGIVTDSGMDGVVVRDGTVRQFANGVMVTFAPIAPKGGKYLRLIVRECTSSNAMSGGEGWLFEDCAAVGNTTATAFFSQEGAVFSRCVAIGNTSNTASAAGAFSAGAGSMLLDCAAINNSNSGGGGMNGILAATGSILKRCLVTGNSSTGSFCHGIQIQSKCIISECIAKGNTSDVGNANGFLVQSDNKIFDCSASDTAGVNAGTPSLAGVGFNVASNCQVERCLARNNLGDGFLLASASVIKDCASSGNGSGAGTGAGIHTTSSGNRIEGNTCASNDTGIQIAGAGNLIIGNTARSNTTAFNIASDNRYGPVIDLTAAAGGAFSGSSAASTVGSTDPWANFTH